MKARPAIVAHRGASGYLPEHTREAKVLAYGQGADFLEQDVVATRDGRLMVLHDIVLDHVTDVAERFPGRCRSDGRYYVVDFDAEEIERLSVAERRKPGSAELAYPRRFSEKSIHFRVLPLEEEIRLIQALNRTTGRQVGIYPEIKQPDWHRRHGLDLAAMLLEALDSFGYRSADDAAFVQCFDAGELRRCREELGTALRLVQLVDRRAGEGRLTPAALKETAEYADAVAAHYSLLIAPAPAGQGAHAARLELRPAVRHVAERGLALHAYTFRRDDLPPYVRSLEELLGFFLANVEVDAVFSDHPDLAVQVRDRPRGGVE